VWWRDEGGGDIDLFILKKRKINEKHSNKNYNTKAISTIAINQFK
jgi:hypothetical protein